MVGDSRCTYMLRAIDALQHVEILSQPGALMIQAQSLAKFVISFGTHELAEQQATALLAVAELDAADLSAGDKRGLFTARQMKGQILLGQVKSGSQIE